MADFARIWQIAPRKVGKLLGTPFAVYRPAQPTPIGPATAIDVRPCWITADPLLMASTPIKMGGSDGYAGIEPINLRVGDYLVGGLSPSLPAIAYFVASMDLPAPIAVVRCNTTITLRRRGRGSGATAYGGAVETELATRWPAYVSVGKGSQSHDGRAGLPLDGIFSGAVIKLPVGFPLSSAADELIDGLGRVYLIDGVDASPNGYTIAVTTEGA